jgi:hypothetical protein
MDLKQRLEDNIRIQKESKNKLKYWQARHDELELILLSVARSKAIQRSYLQRSESIDVGQLLV